MRRFSDILLHLCIIMKWTKNKKHLCNPQLHPLAKLNDITCVTTLSCSITLDCTSRPHAVCEFVFSRFSIDALPQFEKALVCFLNDQCAASWLDFSSSENGRVLCGPVPHRSVHLLGPVWPT